VVRDLREQTRDFVGGKLLPTLRSILPGHLKPEQFQASVVNAIDAQPKLFANKISLAIAVFNLARLGLDTNPVLQHAFLIPRDVSFKGAGGKWEKRPTVTMQVGYKGLIYLGRRAGLTTICEARVVREGDVFDYAEGMIPNLVHKPKLNSDGKVICAYARALVDGRPVFRVVDLAEINRAMRASASAFPLVWDEVARKKVQATVVNPDSPWATDYEAMVMKTAIRRFYKAFDLADAPALAAAIKVDQDYDVGKTPIPLDGGGAVLPAPAALGAPQDWGPDALDEQNIWGGDDDEPGDEGNGGE